jgi:hypothetical protein
MLVIRIANRDLGQQWRTRLKSRKESRLEWESRTGTEIEIKNRDWDQDQG